MSIPSSYSRVSKDPKSISLTISISVPHPTFIHIWQNSPKPLFRCTFLSKFPPNPTFLISQRISFLFSFFSSRLAGDPFSFHTFLFIPFPLPFYFFLSLSLLSLLSSMFSPTTFLPPSYHLPTVLLPSCYRLATVLLRLATSSYFFLLLPTSSSSCLPSLLCSSLSFPSLSLPNSSFPHYLFPLFLFPHFLLSPFLVPLHLSFHFSHLGTLSASRGSFFF